MAKNKVVKIKKDIPATWEESSKQFCWWKQAEGISERTIDDYKKHIGQFYRAFPEAWQEKNLKTSSIGVFR